MEEWWENLPPMGKHYYGDVCTYGKYKSYMEMESRSYTPYEKSGKTFEAWVSSSDYPVYLHEKRKELWQLSEDQQFIMEEEWATGFARSVFLRKEEERLK